MLASTLAFIGSGFELAFTIQNIIGIVGGVSLGMVLGCIPGLTGTMVIAMMIPLTYYINPLTAIAALVGCYKGSLYGGSTSAILLNTPGTPEASVTCFDGYPLYKQGKGGKALKMALVASVMGDSFSDLVLLTVAVPVAAVALKLGPPEFAMLVLFSLTIVGSLSRGSMLKGLASGFLGLIVAIVGLDPILTTPRYTFGSINLDRGLQLLPLLIGLLALGEILVQVEGIVRGDTDRHKIKEKLSLDSNSENNKLTLGEIKQNLSVIFRSASIGTFFGALPGIGSITSAFVAYDSAKRTSKHPEKFGKGNLEGIAAPEAANNAVCGANLIPTITLGIPGSLSAAVLMGAFMIHGMMPGPMLMQEHPSMLYGLFILMLLANATMLLLGFPFIKLARRLFSVSKTILFPVILILCCIGAYGCDLNIFDMKVMVVFGLGGYLMKKTGLNPAAFLIAFILSPLLENSIRQSLIMSRGSPLIFFTRPICVVLIGITILSILWPIRQYFREKSKLKTKG